MPSDARVRYQAVQAVAAHRMTDVAPALRSLAREDAAIPVRIAATRALGEMRDAAATALLVQLSAHNEVDLAAAAIEALGQLPGPHAAHALQQALFSEQPRLQRAALDGMSEPHFDVLLPEVQRVAA